MTRIDSDDLLKVADLSRHCVIELQEALTDFHDDNIEDGKQRFSLDTYALLFEEIQAQPINYVNQIIYWYGLFSHQRDTFAWKGFAGIALDPAADQVALSQLGGP